MAIERIDARLEFAPEAPGPQGRGAGLEPWSVLAVDDDEEVHAVTEFALRNVTILGRPIRLYHAYSAAHGRRIIPKIPRLAVILLDVVMESEQAGLEMVRFIRETCALEDTRIILRTGQPGYAPELEAISRYDINDYRTKAELTQPRLLATLTAAIRSYRQIHSVLENRVGLECIVRASAELLERRGVAQFSEGVLRQIAALLNVAVDGVFCVQRGAPFGSGRDGRLYIVGAAGELAPLIGRPLEELADRRIVETVDDCLRRRRHRFTPEETVLVLAHAPREAAVYLRTARPLDDMDQRLVEVYASNMATCFTNLGLIERLEQIAFHDPLTDLASRAGLLAWLGARGPKALRETVVALVDVRHFSDINDALSQDMGDAVLVGIARRLRRTLGADTAIARLGVDVFALAGPPQTVRPQLIEAVFGEPLAVEGNSFTLGAAVGLHRPADGSESPRTVLKRATIALNKAKRSPGERSLWFHPEMEHSARRRTETIRDLRADFLAHRLELWYQPQLRLSDRRVVGMEALLRWPGRLGPAEFVPLAEYCGLIISIGQWALRRACEDFLRMQGGPGAPERMAVNVSVAQLRSKDFVAAVTRILEQTGLPARHLELEITESLALEDPQLVADRLDCLRGLGISLAVDDFGTGYSSLSHLQQVPADRLKIDRQFVAEIGTGPGERLAECVIGLGKNFRMQVVAEGVETEAQAEFLRRHGCDEAQGYLFARPMPFARAAQWLRDRA